MAWLIQKFKYLCRIATALDVILKVIQRGRSFKASGRLWRAKFFEHAAFYGGTALRILYKLDRFSENLDFSLLKKDESFKLSSYLNAIQVELESQGFGVTVDEKKKSVETAIESAFIKAGTKEHLLKIEVPQRA